ncbi:tetratricopeptide repeat protein [Pseudoalteromonas espejiana]
MQSQSMSFQEVSNLILKEINNNNFLKALKIANSIKSSESSVAAHLHHLKSIAYQKKKDYKQCLAEIEKGIKLKPEHLHLNINKAKLYNLIGESDKAIKQYLTVLSIYNNEVEALYNVSVLYFKNKEFNKSKEYIDKAFNISPKSSVIFSAKIKTYLKLENYTEVTTLADGYISHFGAEPSILNSKGLALKALCRWDEAITTFKQSLKLSPNLLEAKKI